jgi:hypothetical protein
MAYDFEGFFASVPEDTTQLLADAKRQWSEARVRAIDEPFCGIGVGLIIDGSDPLANNPHALASAYENFVGWTCRYPHIAFVWINASCFGGRCIYLGKVVRNGIYLAREEGDGALGRLVAHLGMTLGPDGYFEPFMRGYFED